MKPKLIILLIASFVISFAVTYKVQAQECACTYNNLNCTGESWPVSYTCCGEGVPCRYYRHKYFEVCLATNVYGYTCSCAYWC